MALLLHIIEMTRMSPTSLSGRLDRKWIALQAAALGFVVFEILASCVRFMAFQIDRVAYVNAAPSVRQVLIQYRVGELYRALFYCVAAIFAGWLVAKTHRAHPTLAVLSLVSVLGISLLIAVFTGPGYYLRDLFLIAFITTSPLIGRKCVGKEKIGTTPD